MAIKVGGTTVIDDSRQLSNIASVDAATVTALSTAGAGLPSQTGNAGFYLTTNGTTATWAAVATGGAQRLAVTSSQVTIANGLTVSSGGISVTGAVDFGDWTITESGGSLYFATGGTNKMKLDATGNLDVVGNVNTNATIS